jgi:hypothetical protein
VSHPKDILPEDENGDWHGYCESYWNNGNLIWRGVIFHGIWYGYFDEYNEDGSVDEEGTGYWLSGRCRNDRISRNNVEGFCYIWNREEL